MKNLHLCPMILSFVVAASENNVIGKQNGLPWHLPEDLKFFKKTTLGKPVVMGRKTMESLGKPLPGRTNIILSKTMDKPPADALVMPGIPAALDYLKAQGAEEASIIGGGGVFESTLDIVDRIYLTRVHTHIHDGDTFFPEFRDSGAWKLTWEEPHTKDERHAYDFTFQQWERIRS